MKDIDGVFFTGGEDISPSLYAVPQTEANKGEEINATRDISDYTLMDYCIENDVPSFAACRGMQIMSIVSGSGFIQDVPDYYAARNVAYNDAHRMPAGVPNRDYARHDGRYSAQAQNGCITSWEVRTWQMSPPGTTRRLKM